MSMVSDVASDLDQTVLRLQIDGAWSSQEFAELISDVEFLVRVRVHVFEGDNLLYSPIDPRFFEVINLLYRTTIEAASPREAALARLQYAAIAQNVERFVIREGLTLQALRAGGGEGGEFDIDYYQVDVRRVRFESPGFIDIGGFGKIAGHVKELILKAIDVAIYAKDRQITRDLAEQQVLSERIKNLEKFLDLSDKAGLDKETKVALMMELMRTGDRFVKLTKSNKLTDIETIKE